MIYELSNIDEARMDTLIHRSEGESLNRLSQLYGFNRPLFVKESDWREALHDSVFNAQPSAQVVYNFIHKCLRQWTKAVVYEMTATSVNTAGTTDILDGNYESRLVMINGVIHFLSHYDKASKTATFSNLDTSYWKGVSFTEGEVLQVEIVPFLVEEHGCIYRLILDSGVFRLPATYLQEDASQDQTEGEPKYGYIMDFTSTDDSVRFGDNGFPLYLASDYIEQSFRLSVGKLLSAGVFLQAQNTQWTLDSPSLYADFSSVLNGQNASAVGSAPPTPERT